MKKVSELTELAKNGLELATEVEGTTIHVTAKDEDNYKKFIEEETGVNNKKLDEVIKVTEIYGKAAVAKLGETLEEAYKKNAKADGFVATIPYFNNDITGKGDKEVSGVAAGNEYTSTGFTISHKGFNIPSKTVKKKLFDSIND